MQRKIAQNCITYLTFNVETQKPEIKDVFAKVNFTDNEKALAYIRKNVDNRAIMVTNVQSVEKMMVCTKESYMKVAKVITVDTDKHGLVTSTIKMPLVSAHVFNLDSGTDSHETFMVSKDVSGMEHEKALALVRKEKETDNLRIIDIGISQFKTEMYGCTLEQFMKIAHEKTEDDIDDYDDEENTVEIEA